jgi:S-adenosylmethionine:tRNA ribosyltransferase-isomerase
MLLTPLPLVLETAQKKENGRFLAEVECLLRASKRIREGEVLAFGALRATVLERGPYGQCRALLEWQGSLSEHFAREGHIPLPPYIRRPDKPEDAERYQTVYAREEGSVAAPTAGLHFTRALLHTLAERHFGWVEIHLHVGYGTFSPVHCEDIRSHRMHREYLVISQKSADAVARAKSDGRPVIAVGTTAARALEGCAAACGKPTAFRAWTDIFLYPGFEFQILDGLITNVHLPESSLLMLVSAFAGRKNVLNSYLEAIQHGYRFFSYGDAMLIV